MNSEELTALMHIIPDNDENCDLKRVEIARWYKVYGAKIICPRDMEEIMNVLPNLISDTKFWNNGFRLNNLYFAKELLEKIGFTQQKERSFIFNLYRLACFISSEDHILDIFRRLDKNKSWSIEEYVPDILTGYGPLVKFWSHYINVVGIENPNPVILSSFKKILSGYSEDFDVNNINDVWKCGFECAREEGSREALEFFWNKLEHLCTEEEKQETLLYVGINAYELCWYPRTGRNSKDNSFNLVEFSLNHLGVDKYNLFMEECLKNNRHIGPIVNMIDNYLYNNAKELIEILGPNVISYKKYGDVMVYHTLAEMHKIPSELKKHSLSFFVWLWCLKEFDEHRKYCLSDLDHIFRSLVITGEGDSNILIEPLQLILSSASPEQIRKDFVDYPGLSILSTLYIKNEREILQNEVLKFFDNGDKFISHVDSVTLSTIKEHKKLNDLDHHHIFNLYTQGKTEEFIKYIEDSVDDPKGFFYWLMEKTGDVFSEMIRGKMNFDQNIYISSQISDVEFGSLVSGINK